MRAVVQRVSEASVKVDGEVVGQIGRGLLLLVGVAAADSVSDADALAAKIAALRIFEDAEEKMNLSLQDVGGAVLAVSQFTLLGDARRGRRPSFDAAARPEQARELFNRLVEQICSLGLECQTGCFQATMQVSLVNDGPVTILIDSTKLF